MVSKYLTHYSHYLQFLEIAHMAESTTFSKASPTMQHFRQPVASGKTVSGAHKDAPSEIALSAPATFARHLNFALKRLMDIFGSAIGLILLCPFFLLVAILIRIDSPGRIFFVQERWGRGKKPIRVLKFRTMYDEHCDSSGVNQTVKDDSRITRVGTILRRTSFDELPQLINVLVGDMSLVGPRCHVIGMKGGGKLYEDLVPHYHLRHAVRPGITGLAQVSGYRGPTTMPEKAIGRLRCDLEYIQKFNILLDIKILTWTIFKELRGGTGF